jgi:hypothetical protein
MYSIGDACDCKGRTSDGVAGLVVRDGAFLFGRKNACLLLQARNHPLNGRLKMHQGHRLQDPDPSRDRWVHTELEIEIEIDR